MTHEGRAVVLAAAALVLGVASGCGSNGSGGAEPVELGDPAEVTVGERFFLETRFAQLASTQLQADVNRPLAHSDPILNETMTTGDPLPGPFHGASMNCRACHLVDEHADDGGGNRTYADFARRSPLPAREDGLATTSRNSPALVDATLERGDFLLHFDGEFASMPDLTRATLTGRNFGWLPTEQPKAVAWIARVVREDDGHDALAADTGGLSFATLLAGTDPAIPESLRLPPSLRVDGATASDDAVLDGVTHVISAYVDSLRFARDADGVFVGSPFDRFLEKNGLPRQPAPGESDLAYARRLRDAVAALAHPRLVSAADGEFTTGSSHPHDFVFAGRELAGLRIFLAEPASRPPTAEQVAAGGVGNCIACHQPPRFTDFGPHNTGAAQDEYDAIHGDGAFAALDVPDLTTRSTDPARFLPPSAAHPTGSATFREVPSADRPGVTDLGAWNVFANADLPGPQTSLQDALCRAAGSGADCSAAALLPRSIALFKTPSLRDLAQSNPYLHTGREDTLGDVIDFYVRMAGRARAGAVRNADPELGVILLTPADRDALVAFLQSLDEDYE
ncbi:MAG TPA: hypothetical protein VGK30_20930 [Candidatus Binatia bacterium]|jgi:mono/diheme cytochrome c family protein